jgi:hypothetical protein
MLATHEAATAPEVEAEIEPMLPFEERAFQPEAQEADMNALAKTEPAPQASEVVPFTEAGSLMAVISRAASDPAVDVDKLERLMGLYERMSDRSAKGAYAAALAEMQPSLPIITEKGAISTDKGRTIQSTYAKWEDINQAIGPVLAAHGFALSFRTGLAGDGKITVTGVLSHKDGHQEETTMTLPHDSSGSKNAVQAVGSSTSYGKRYTAMALLNITSRGEDDDASAGMSAAAQGAIASINDCEGADALRAWKTKNYSALADMLAPTELKAVVELYNRRIKAAKGGSQANG